ncbi:MAG: efflux RND transporter permease subunit [Alphaproteobacteria bacterium]|nr:efflux RND transporter permease subunit [Alphaproteobacteria bacterium]
MSTLAETSIKRPVFATVMNIMLVLIGIVCFDRLPVREYPNIDTPVVTVETKYVGASAEIMETQVTKPLEDELSGIEGVDFIRSVNRAESSQVTVQFRLTRNPDAAANDVRDRVSRSRGRLPDDVEEPIVARVEADASPMMWVNLNSEVHNQLEVSEVADLLVQDRLAILDGVARVNVFAARKLSMRIWLDALRLGGYGLTTEDVENALREQNVEIPAGRVESASREFTVLSQTDLNTPEQFAAITLRREENGGIVRLGDVARIVYGAVDERQVARFMGRNSVSLAIVKQSTANPLEISKRVRQSLGDLQKSIPDGMHLDVAYDSSVFINASIKAVFRTIFEATVLVALVTFLFLRSARVTLIPLVTIPVSLIGALALMYAFGFTLNTLTLLSMVIAIGLVVDDAIVVLENTTRHVEKGMAPFEAALTSMREISFAVVAMTITLAAVFAPMAFATGATGRLFIEFALTLSAAVLISGFVALTLAPMLCSKLLHREEQAATGWKARSENTLRAVETGYARWLGKTLSSRRAIYSGAGAVALLAALIFFILPRQLTPAEDRGVLFLSARAPEGSTVGYSDRYMRDIEEIFEAIPEARAHFVAIGFPVIVQSTGVILLKDWSERSRHSTEINESLRSKLSTIPGLLASTSNPPSLGQNTRSLPIDFVIASTSSFEDLSKVANELVAKMQQNPNFITPDSDLKLSMPELKITVDRDKAAALGISVESIGRTLETMLGSRQVTRFKRSGEQYDVLVQIENNGRERPQDINSIHVRAASGEMVPLGNLVTLKESVAPRELNHFNKLRAAKITANLAPGYALGEALDWMKAELEKIDATAIPEYFGQSREFKESSSSLGLIFTLALVFIYLVLAAQFESWLDPLVILLTVPLALFGALLAVWLTGGSLNVYTQIGLIALVGLIAKNGILIVEFANQLQERGANVLEAMQQAALIRLRPILMTTAATILGAVPLALAAGAGAEARAAIGWVVVGGMSVGTLMTLFVVPAFYVLLSVPKHKHAAAL